MKGFFLTLVCLLIGIIGKSQIISFGPGVSAYTPKNSTIGSRVLPRIDLRYDFFPSRQDYNVGVGIVGPVIFDNEQLRIITGVIGAGNLRYFSGKKMELRAGLDIRYLRGDFISYEIDFGYYATYIRKKNAFDFQLAPAIFQFYQKKRKAYFTFNPSLGAIYLFGPAEKPANYTGNENAINPLCFTVGFSFTYNIPIKK